jgi:uncharacterized protein YjbI with pentapeptide repeats
MANAEHVAKLQEGVAAWNSWRTQNPDIRPDLQREGLSPKILDGANLRGADLRFTNLKDSKLAGADLRGADLRRANLIGVNLSCSSLITSGVLLDNIRRFQLRLFENIRGLVLRLIDNVLTLSDNSLITSISAHIK